MTSFWTLRRQMDDLMNQMMSMDDPAHFAMLSDPLLAQPFLAAPFQQQPLLQATQQLGTAAAPSSSSTSTALTQDQPQQQQLGLFGQQTWPSVIRCDVNEEKDKFVVHAELPGVQKDHVQVTLDNGFLTITGDKKEVVNERQDVGGRTIRRRERKFGQFTRSFRLPTMAESDNVTARFSNGVLTLDIPKVDKTTQQTKRIQIQ